MNFGEVLFVPLLALQITLTLREAIYLACQVVEINVFQGQISENLFVLLVPA